jgi:hypothetical protein
MLLRYPGRMDSESVIQAKVIVDPVCRRTDTVVN